MTQMAMLHLLRTGLIALLSLFIVHFFSYDTLPWQDGYRFPLTSWLIITSFGFLICSINWFVYARVSLERIQSNFIRLISYIGINMAVTITSYAVLFPLINVILLGYSFSWTVFFKFLFVLLLIITVEFSVVVIYKMVKRVKRQHAGFFVDSGSRQLIVDPDEILCFRSHSKMIKIFLRSGKSYYTQHHSLEEVGGLLHGEPFFRINRNFLVHKDAIESVQKDNDRRLVVFLQALPGELQDMELRVSRYRSKDFSHWFTTEMPVFS